MTEDQLEHEALGWLAEVGYTPRYGPDLAPDGEHPERDGETLGNFARLISGQLRLPEAQAELESARP